MFDKIKVLGGNPLFGDVHISGAKNSVSAILPALCLAEENSEFTIRNVPDIDDVDTLCSLLGEIGMTTKRNREDNSIFITGKPSNNCISSDFAPKIRASNLFMGSLLATTGEVSIPFCGGDKIGDRPLDIHFYIFDKFKIKTEVREGNIHCKATEYPFTGTTIYLRYPSVGATENAIILACKAIGTTHIYNAACEPEITDLAVALNKMGAKITGAGTPFIKIHGVPTLGSMEHDTIPDRLEACTFLLAFSCTGGKGKIYDAIPEHCISVINTLEDAGVSIQYRDSIIEVDATNRSLKALKVNALPYPGIPTDVQPLLSVFSTQCRGNSIINDSVFKERFSYAKELIKMGIESHHSYDHICVSGPQQTKRASVTGGDIRSVSALILAALMADGESVISGYEHVRRGYDSFNHKLTDIGATVKLI